ncbi:MAG: anti-sigma F factor [Clostridia bacterium]|nr:anti-sigma F factor [Clostridia bacterium]
MKLLNEANFTFDSRSCNEAFARSAVGSFITYLDPTVSELNDIRTAVSEAVTNCVVHAYQDTIGKIFINIKIWEGGTVTIKIRDKGCGIENIAQAMEPLYTTAPSEERAGLGFAVMQSFSDSVKVRSKPEAGTTVTLTKKLSLRVSNG